MQRFLPTIKEMSVRVNISILAIIFPLFYRNHYGIMKLYAQQNLPLPLVSTTGLLRAPATPLLLYNPYTSTPFRLSP